MTVLNSVKKKALILGCTTDDYDEVLHVFFHSEMEVKIVTPWEHPLRLFAKLMVFKHGFYSIGRVKLALQMIGIDETWKRAQLIDKIYTEAKAILIFPTTPCNPWKTEDR
uniref:Uncharacterized protein n=1 Tax=Romanomermis culicivorax TaxID=13658 RepID=A0A915HHH5_ROMCU